MGELWGEAYAPAAASGPSCLLWQKGPEVRCPPGSWAVCLSRGCVPSFREMKAQGAEAPPTGEAGSASLDSGRAR